MDLIRIQDLAAQNGPRYWRSLDELAGTPAFRTWAEQQFGDSAQEMLAGNSRRSILKLMAASFGLAGLVACRRPEEKILPLAKGVEELVPGKPVHYASAMPWAGYANGIVVETHDGRPTKIEGNRNHPGSLGAASAFAQASVLNIYDPDRSKTVLRGGKASNWAEFSKALPGVIGDGSGLRILAERTSSPTLHALKNEILKKYPAAQWVWHSPLTNEESLEATRVMFGAPHEVLADYSKADVVLAIDDDFLGLDSASTSPLTHFSRKRKVNNPGDPMNRLYAVESHFSITGAMADHRLRIRPSEVAKFVQALAVELGVTPALKVLSEGDKSQKWIAAVARDLKANAGKSVVSVGPRQPAAVHAVVIAINNALGNVGATVNFVPSVYTQERDALKNFVGGLAGKTLVILGGNPAYTMPADLGFAEKAKAAANVIHLGLEVDETAALASWHLPMAHYLEAWGDVRAQDGTASIVQPMIAPLYGGKSAIEVAAMLAGAASTKGYDVVRATWQANWKPEEREAVWRKSLHDGVIAGTAQPPAKVAVDTKKLPGISGTSGTDLDIVFLASASNWDGVFANNAWMQEAPDPMTKLVWDNAAFFSPATAKKLGLADGDLIEITTAAGKAQFAAMAAPGTADSTVVVTLGYGRKEIGRVGKDLGFNAYPLKTAAGFATGVSVRKLGGTHQLVTTQEHHTMVEPLTGLSRPIVREGTAEHYKEHPEFVGHMVHLPEMFDLQGTHDYSQGNQWGMVIDLNACVGCNACLVACNSENNIPVVGKEQVAKGRDMHWIRLDRYYTGSAEDPQAVMQPVGCMQCEAAPCENVCPVAATVHSPEGLNDMAYNRCIGTRYCMNNCPYKVRRFNYLNWHKQLENDPTLEPVKMAHNPDVSVRMRGVMEKCTYCVQRIQEKKIQAKTEGRRRIRDGEILTACQQTCPAEAIIFGNINDPESAVSKARKQQRDYKLLEELNTKPRTSFLAKLRNPNKELVNG